MSSILKGLMRENGKRTIKSVADEIASYIGDDPSDSAIVDAVEGEAKIHGFDPADLFDAVYDHFRHYIDENLHKWFKEKWVRFGPDGKIRGDCARGSDSEGKPKCLPQSKAHNLGKKGRASAASRKRKEDPNPDRSGKAINVATKKKKTNEEQMDESCWKGYHKEGTKKLFGKNVPNCVKNEDIQEEHEMCPECGGPMYPESMINEKQDACYRKVKSRYKVWPSAYASGALVQCRKKGASNWGNGGKKNESSVMQGVVDEEWTHGHERGNTSHWSGAVNSGSYTHDGRVVAKYQGFEHPSTFTQSHMKVKFLPTGKVKQFRSTNSGFAAAEKWILSNLGADQTESIGESTPKSQRWVAPKTLDMMYQKQAYDREVASMKDANKPKNSGRYQPTVQVGSTSVLKSQIEDWQNNKDITAAAKILAKKYAGPQTDAILSDIVADPEFQRVSTNFWNYASDQVSRDSKRDSEDRVPFEYRTELYRIAIPYLKKHGVDKTGRRVPPGFKYNLNEDDEEVEFDYSGLEDEDPNYRDWRDDPTQWHGEHRDPDWYEGYMNRPIKMVVYNNQGRGVKKTVRDFTKTSPTTAEVDVGEVGGPLPLDFDRQSAGRDNPGEGEAHPFRDFYCGERPVTARQAFNLFQTKKHEKKGNRSVEEASSPAQQAAIAINMKKHHKKPKHVDEINNHISANDQKIGYADGLKGIPRRKDNRIYKLGYIQGLAVVAKKRSPKMFELGYNDGMSSKPPANNNQDYIIGYNTGQIYTRVSNPYTDVSKNKPDKNVHYIDDIDEDYTGIESGPSTGPFTAEKTPAINPYGGMKDRKYRGAIGEGILSEMPDTSGPVDSDSASFRTAACVPACRSSRFR